MLYPATKKASRKVIAWYDYVFIALSAAVPIYMCVDYVNIINRAGKPDMMDVVIGTLLTLVVLEATRRVCGMALPIISIIFMIYSLMGTKQGLIDRCPGHFPPQRIHMAEVNEPLLLEHGRYLRIVSQCCVHLHLPLHRLGEVMNKCGMGQFFNDFANAIAGRHKGRPGKGSSRCFRTSRNDQRCGRSRRCYDRFLHDPAHEKIRL